MVQSSEALSGRGGQGPFGLDEPCLWRVSDSVGKYADAADN
jgi:hypothetical protein